MNNTSIIIGVLALQGSFVEHAAKLHAVNAKVREVRKESDLDGISGLIIPGGESTAISLLLMKYGLYEPLKKKIEDGLSVYGTCAGAILLSEKVSGKIIPESLGVLDINIERNAYGGQLDSFVEEIEIPTLELKNFPAVFIRAPIIKKVGRGVEVLAKRSNGEIVLVRAKNILVSTFHPELSKGVDVHRYFVEKVVGE